MALPVQEGPSHRHVRVPCVSRSFPAPTKDRRVRQTSEACRTRRMPRARANYGACTSSSLPGASMPPSVTGPYSANAMPATAGRPAMSKSAKIMARFIMITSLLSPCANATLGGSFPGPNCWRREGARRRLDVEPRLRWSEVFRFCGVAEDDSREYGDRRGDCARSARSHTRDSFTSLASDRRFSPAPPH